MDANRTLAALALAACAAVPLRSGAAVFISVRIAPPALPVYEQPVCPGEDYIWTPGYWQWDAAVADYYWIPGTWVLAPQPGYLWTPGYWGFENAAYIWHGGYWGPHIGFYGGVNYGFGYFGSGFAGGYWNGPHFFYNTSITRVNVNVVHNTYIHNVTVINNTHVAFNGGPGGVAARPSAGEQAAFRENHVAPTGVQVQHAGFAQANRSQFFNANRGIPPAAALTRPAQSQNAFRANAAPAQSAGGPGTSPGVGYHNGGFRGNTNQPAAQRGFADGSQGQRGLTNSNPSGQNGYRPGGQANTTPQVDRSFQPQTQPGAQQPYSRPQSEPRPQPQPQYNHAPEARPAPQPHQEPRPESRPAPHAEPHEHR